jgi:hypothetical protein
MTRIPQHWPSLSNLMLSMPSVRVSPGQTLMMLAVFWYLARANILADFARLLGDFVCLIRHFGFWKFEYQEDS